MLNIYIYDLNISIDYKMNNRINESCIIIGSTNKKKDFLLKLKFCLKITIDLRELCYLCKSGQN